MKDKIKESQIEKIRNHYKDHFDVQFLISEIDRLQQDRDKLIEGLRDAIEYLRLLGVDSVGEDVLRKLVTICEEIEVTVE